MEQGIDDFVIVEPDQHTAYSVPILWLTPEEEAQFSEWRQHLKVVIPFWTAVFSGLHILSIIVSQLRGQSQSSLKPKDKYQWHNKYGPQTNSIMGRKAHVAQTPEFSLPNLMPHTELLREPMQLQHLSLGYSGFSHRGKCLRLVTENLFSCPSTRTSQPLGLDTSSMTSLQCWPWHPTQIWLSWSASYCTT